jgi:putative redox protein
MANSIVRWVTGRQFIGTDSTKHSVVLSSTEMLLVALSSCTAVDIVDILEKKKIKMTLLEIKANGEQDQDPPWTYRKIHLHYMVAAKGLTDSVLEHIIDLSVNKYCSVAATIRGVAEIVTSFEIVNE